MTFHCSAAAKVVVFSATCFVCPQLRQTNKKKNNKKKRNNNGNVTGKNARVGGCDKIYDSRWVELNRPKKRNFAEIKRFV